MCNPSKHHSSSSSCSSPRLGHGVVTGTITAAVRALIPAHPVCIEALAIAKSTLPASILYHSLRVYFYAAAFMRLFEDTLPSDAHYAPSICSSLISEDDNPTPGCIARAPPHVLFVACILHDIGTASTYDNIPERFEVVSADVAARLLRSHGVPEKEVRDAWLAMSLHTSPGIAERLGGTVRALRLGVRADFNSYPPPPSDKLIETWAEVIRWQLPRLEIEKELGDAVCEQGIQNRQKAPGGSWPGDLVRARREDPDWDGVNRGF
ncbi:hypothetical protein QBC40DRAFT_313424 [Triangularia verruculosa]|uniref:HD/PDEase domain-containing protein n=1 Tax=Triangularia verruculosa TaxID=2587418 RepID=A0AAN6XNK2_9PEZI|nr:hypothetical protein QBC40DRAFT_313424 [Triangularia verruculosa]